MISEMCVKYKRNGRFFVFIVLCVFFFVKDVNVGLKMIFSVMELIYVLFSIW